MIKLFFKLFQRFNLLSFFNFYHSIYLEKKKIKIPLLQGVGYSNLNISELWMIDLLKIVLPLGDKIFVDVGANIGQTLIKIKSVKKDIIYFGLEPNASCVHYLNCLIKKNNFTKTIILPVGISTETSFGELNYFYDSSTDSSATILPQFRPDHKVFKKESIALFDVTTINNYFTLDGLSILKIDVEGSELEVLISFQDLIERNKPIIFIEILPVYNQENIFRQTRQKEAETLIRQMGYSIYRVLKCFENLVDLVEINEIRLHSEISDCDYVLVPNSKKINLFNSLYMWKNNKKN